MPSSDIRCTCTTAIESAANCAIHSFFRARSAPESTRSADIAPLREAPTVALDPIGALRWLADELERNPEKVHAIGVVTLTGHNAIDSYGYGPDGNLAQVSLMFQTAIQRATNGFD